METAVAELVKNSATVILATKLQDFLYFQKISGQQCTSKIYLKASLKGLAWHL
jgi:hypothetical protein